ncbi:MAG TPA: bifunctional GNAT family N-acetyltransferase/hotdog fold thioesterase [Rheinheimera sp.]|nr:bifunctional GNAT family N-acetyltransferase/hotdog fold thioesterase [Rheinheimera sp.]
MRQWQIKQPETEQEWQRYYQLRYDILRAPWQQPLGSERDELESEACHQMLVTPQGEVAAVGRLHKLADGGAQVRYMAVAEQFQGKGAGGRVLSALEQQAAEWQCRYIKLNARESAQAFYQRFGYLQIGSAPEQFGIAHYVMQKAIFVAGDAGQFNLWCQQLAGTWRKTIPLSQFMQLGINSFDGNALCCQAPLAPNINLHGTMFAGSIYTLATLTGWGMLYLQLQALGISGDQVLADANIKYYKPVSINPEARCVLQNCYGSLSALADGHKVVQHIKVQIFSDAALAAEFIGKYVVLPHKGAR